MTNKENSAEPANVLGQPAKIPREIWIMVSAAFLIALGYGLIAPLLPQFVVSFDVSMAAAGMVVSIFRLAVWSLRRVPEALSIDLDPAGSILAVFLQWP